MEFSTTKGGSNFLKKLFVVSVFATLVFTSSAQRLPDDEGAILKSICTLLKSVKKFGENYHISLLGLIIYD